MWQSRSVAILIFVFVFGSIIGSFLNVCITRIPEEVSIVAPGSRCPQCLTPIQPYDNVPIFAWFWLRGKCRKCGNPISAMYPLIELGTALVFVAVYSKFGLTQATVKWLFFLCLIIVLTITDLRVRLLPDVVNWPGFAAGLLFSAFVPPEDGFGYLVSERVLHRMLPTPAVGILDGLLGAAFGSLLLLGVGWAYRIVRGRDGLGLGDVKMMAMVGAFLGLRGTFFTILIGTLLGSVIGLALVVGFFAARWKAGVAARASRRGLGTEKGLRWAIASRYQLPLGTFLGIAAMIVVFFFSSGDVSLIPRIR
jgi:leader peptidase (prepilin peptidase) / N-methyltransferase